MPRASSTSRMIAGTSSSEAGLNVLFLLSIDALAGKTCFLLMINNPESVP